MIQVETGKTPDDLAGVRAGGLAACSIPQSAMPSHPAQSGTGFRNVAHRYLGTVVHPSDGCHPPGHGRLHSLGPRNTDSGVFYVHNSSSLWEAEDATKNP